MNAQNWDLMDILELPGLSRVTKLYTKTSINVDNTYLNRKQFVTMSHKNSTKIFCYGDMEIFDPIRMFVNSKIETFISKGSITLHGDTTRMFYCAKKFNSDLSKWDVKNVIVMTAMFFNAFSFKSDLSRWNVENCEYMSFMFRGSTSFDSDLSKWNVGKVENMISMFEETVYFCSDLTSWNVENVVDWSYIFCDAISFDTFFSPKFRQLT